MREGMFPHRPGCTPGDAEPPREERQVPDPRVQVREMQSMALFQQPTASATVNAAAKRGTARNIHPCREGSGRCPGMPQRYIEMRRRYGRNLYMQVPVLR